MTLLWHVQNFLFVQQVFYSKLVGHLSQLYDFFISHFRIGDIYLRATELGIQRLHEVIFLQDIRIDKGCRSTLLSTDRVTVKIRYYPFNTYFGYL